MKLILLKRRIQTYYPHGVLLVLATSEILLASTGLAENSDTSIVFMSP